MEYARLANRDKALKIQASIFGDNVKKLREEKKWTPLDLAFYSNCSLQTIYNVESGSGNITMETQINISIALETTVIELLRATEHQRPDQLPLL